MVLENSQEGAPICQRGQTHANQVTHNRTGTEEPEPRSQMRDQDLVKVMEVKDVKEKVPK